MTFDTTMQLISICICLSAFESAAIKIWTTTGRCYWWSKKLKRKHLRSLSRVLEIFFMSQIINFIKVWCIFTIKSINKLEKISKERWIWRNKKLKSMEKMMYRLSTFIGWVLTTDASITFKFCTTWQFAKSNSEISPKHSKLSSQR